MRFEPLIKSSKVKTREKAKGYTSGQTFDQISFRKAVASSSELSSESGSRKYPENYFYSAHAFALNELWLSGIIFILFLSCVNPPRRTPGILEG
jgi:hypothetical protein